MINVSSVSRRSVLRAALLAAAPVIRGHGKISPPQPVPDIALVRHDGAATSLVPLVTGYATAVQLMFTACTTTCPIQAAIFQRVQTMIQSLGDRGVQLLSLSIDPAEDTPKALTAWRRRFHAGSDWIAAAPAMEDIPRVQEFFGKTGGADHSTQVHILNRQGRLIWRTFELPTADEVMGILRKV
jgi:protein SCO1/2